MGCEVCGDLRTLIFAPNHPTTAFQASAHKDCRKCALVLEAIDSFKPHWLKSEEGTRGSIGLNTYQCPLTISLCKGKDERDVIGSFQLLRRYHHPTFDSQFMQPHFQYTLPIVKDSSSDAAFSVARQWLKHCEDSHEECKLKGPGFTPRRLINVGSEKPVLVEPKSQHRYAALSYCWGPDSSDFLKTTKENLDSHKKAIDFALLPKTIQDAMTFCRGLRISYLWVDALCILQGDTEDWLEQSQQMSQIYGNSRITIAADEPKSCKVGFLGRQKFSHSAWQRPFHPKVKGYDSDDPSADLFIRTGETPQTNDVFPLQKRGWTLQESILPNRKIRFNCNEMVWDCNYRHVCECGHFLTAHYSGHGSVKTRLSSYAWRAIVEEFTKRELSYDTDKLAALSGLAKLIEDHSKQEKTPDMYLAGLWRSDLMYGLTWCASRDEICTRPLGYRAPTWSWASVNGPVSYIDSPTYFREKSEIEFIEVHCRPLPPQHSKEEAGKDYLLVTGQIVPVQLTVLDKYIEYEETGKQDKLYREAEVRGENLLATSINLDVAMDIHLKHGDHGFRCWADRTCRRNKLKDGHMCHFDKAKAKFFCLKICSVQNERVPDLAPEIFYLVLKKSSNFEGAYERVGTGDSLGYSAGTCSVFDNHITKATIKII